MKLLHTGDLHLGKTLHEASLLEDQAVMLNQILARLGEDGYDALLISGDIYDRTIPPAPAVELFSDFLVHLTRDFPDLHTFIIPGNHDSARRLSFADRILGEKHIHIIGNPEQTFSPINITLKNGRRTAFFLLPFLSSLSLTALSGPAVESTSGEFDFNAVPQEASPLVSQADLAREAARRLSPLVTRLAQEGVPSILLAHLFTTGGVESESERVFLGTAERVSPELFSSFSYVALGHLHRAQRVTDRIHYAGSPLAYAFDEANTVKQLVSITLDETDPAFPLTVSALPVSPLRAVRRLSGSFTDFYTGTQFDSYSPDYLEIHLTDASLVANPMSLLRQKFPFLLSIRQGTSTQAEHQREQGMDEMPLGDKRDPLSDFSRFIDLLYGEKDPEKELLFQSLLKECLDEA